MHRSTDDNGGLRVLVADDSVLLREGLVRLLREGGYEGVEDMDEYGLPAPYSFAVEELIAQTVDELMQATSVAR